ncbi:MAG: hypothetical protein Tsb0019_28890 [Roseibium sp.]
MELRGRSRSPAGTVNDHEWNAAVPALSRDLPPIGEAQIPDRGPKALTQWLSGLASAPAVTPDGAQAEIRGLLATPLAEARFDCAAAALPVADPLETIGPRLSLRSAGGDTEKIRRPFYSYPPGSGPQAR